MPEGTAGDDQQQQQSTGQQPPQDPPKTFTQEELDAILRDRLARAKPADYDELKAKAAQLDEAENAKKDEIQKAKDEAAREKQARVAIEAKANATLKRAMILTEAADKATDPDIVVALLANSEAITVDKDGNVNGVKEAVSALLKSKPILDKANASTSGGEFNGNDKNKESLDAQIAEAEKAGNWTESFRLKGIKAAQNRT